MAKNIRKIATQLGAKIGDPVPDVGGGAFGMARLGALLSNRLTPIRGKRPGRPSDPLWVENRKVPMSEATLQRLEELAQQLSSDERRVSPMQVAAQLLEAGLDRVNEESK